MGLAKRYFAEAPNRDFLFDQAKSISLLQPPPSWGLAPTMPADWVLKQRLRESLGKKGTNRRDRRSRSRSTARGQKADGNDKVEIEKYLDEKQKTLAVIACGFGPGEDDEERRRKRNKMLIWGAVAAALVAVSYTVIMQNCFSGGNAVGTHGDSSGNTERDLLETKKNCPLKSDSLTTETRTQSKGMKGNSPVTLSMTRNENLSKPLREIMSTHETRKINMTRREQASTPPGERKLSKQEATKIVSSQRKLVESTHNQTSVSTETAREHNSPLMSGPTMASSRSTFVKPKASVDTTALSSFPTRAGTIYVTVPAPLRFMKNVLVRIRQFVDDTSVDQIHDALKNLFHHIPQLVNDVDKVPGTPWAHGVFNDSRQAIDERDPNVEPGAGFLHDFVSKARNVILSGEGARFLKDKFSDARSVLSAGKARFLAHDFVRNAQHFLTSKDGQGARLAKAALDNVRAALVENEAEVVVL
jgi:hypothetical protein